MAKQWSNLQDGLIRPPDALELIASDHCNLTCRQCNHASPILPKWNVDPDDAYRELALLARSYRPRRVKILGGEPLLNPRIAEVITAIRRSGITPHILMVTNGVLLRRLTLDAWRELDEVEISRYPGSGLTDDLLSWIAETARETGTKLTLMTLNDFRFTFSHHANDDAASVAKIFAACKIGTIWGCHAVYRGRFYRCPQSIYIGTFAPLEAREGLALDDEPDFQERLLAFLNDDTPLASCRYCVGTSGRKMPHEMPTRAAWMSDLDVPPAAMLDMEALEAALAVPSLVDDCRIREGNPGPAALPPEPSHPSLLSRLWPW